MLLQGLGIATSQDAIAEITAGVPVGPGSLADALRQLDAAGEWEGGLSECGETVEENVAALLVYGSWAAWLVTHQGRQMHHSVVVDSMQENIVYIRDPYQPGVEYGISLVEFDQFWSRIAVWRRGP